MALFAAAAVVALVYCVAFERMHLAPEPWTRELGAAAAFACGRGFGDPGYRTTPGLEAFLDKHTDSLSCGEDLPPGVPLRPLNFTQSLYPYLTLAAGITWRVFGVSWTRLSPLMAALYGVSAVAIYFLFRLAVPRSAAIVGTAILIASPLQLKYVPQLRDYAKAPFLLTLLLILAMLVVLPVRRSRLLTMTALYGALVGIGFGFRNDLLIALAPLIVTVAGFLPTPLRAHIALRAAAVGACLATFVLCAWPVLATYRGGSNTGHVALLGLMTHFDAPLGVTRPIYDWGAAYDDGLAKKIVTGYSERVYGRTPSELGADYDRAAFEYVLLIARHAPADMVIRAYASVRRVVNLPFDIRRYTTAVPPALAHTAAAPLYEIYAAVLGHLSGVGVLLLAAAAVAVAGFNTRLGVWLVVLFAYLAGYPALQFDSRHFFFLEALSWFAAIGVIVGIWRAITRGAGWWQLRRALIFTGAIALAVAAPVAGLRMYQQRHLTAMFDAYLKAATTPVAWSMQPADAGYVLARVDAPPEGGPAEVRTDYLAADFSGDRCGRSAIAVTARYSAQPGYTDLSREFSIAVDRNAEPSTLMFPAFYTAGASFTGLELAELDRPCLLGIRRVGDLARTPMLLTLRLGVGWRNVPLYQTIAMQPFFSLSRG